MLSPNLWSFSKPLAKLNDAIRKNKREILHWSGSSRRYVGVEALARVEALEDTLEWRL